MKFILPTFSGGTDSTTYQAIPAQALYGRSFIFLDRERG